MKIKSYFARTVEDAMAQAREELGPEAMLVNIIDTPGFGFGEMDHSAPLAGFLAATWGTMVTLTASGVICIVIAGLFYRSIPRLRAAAAPVLAKLDPAVFEPIVRPMGEPPSFTTARQGGEDRRLKDER